MQARIIYHARVQTQTTKTVSTRAINMNCGYEANDVQPISDTVAHALQQATITTGAETPKNLNRANKVKQAAAESD